MIKRSEVNISVSVLEGRVLAYPGAPRPVVLIGEVAGDRRRVSRRFRLGQSHRLVELRLSQPLVPPTLAFGHLRLSGREHVQLLRVGLRYFSLTDGSL